MGTLVWILFVKGFDTISQVFNVLIIYLNCHVENLITNKATNPWSLVSKKMTSTRVIATRNLLGTATTRKINKTMKKPIEKR